MGGAEQCPQSLDRFVVGFARLLVLVSVHLAKGVAEDGVVWGSSLRRS